MLRQCPGCSRVTPADAFYCYFDCTPLLKDLQTGPLRLGSQPFPTILYFSDGTACANFNQLALTCDNRWDEAKSLLVDGIWPTFFAGLGRLDLAAVARQVAKEPDLDRALSQLLEKFPADPEYLRPPKVSLQPAVEDLGQLTPGTDKKFELVVVNQGMLLLHGTVSSGCDWLVFDNRTGPAQKVFQTRNFFSVQVCVLGSKLRAGMHGMQGEIIVETNGGVATLPVRVEVPIRPFPQGSYANDVLAGARTPREIAVKAREHPREAAILFEQGAVKAWYATNGWTYPVEGSQGSGKGAVQQFFEALGLTKPPVLEIDTQYLAFKGRIGERLSKRLTISTPEAKPVYAQARSDRDWATIGPPKYMGNKVKISVDVVVPPQPGVMLHGQVIVQGNGNQQFVVPMSVEVDEVPVIHPVNDGAPAEVVSVEERPEPNLWDQAVDWVSRMLGNKR
ncbi:MAG: hypothetical protein HY289_12105 [Planctomycetes bacterium]|nr:hypothetical protein [Planctomycetota bacterium]